MPKATPIHFLTIYLGTCLHIRSVPIIPIHPIYLNGYSVIACDILPSELKKHKIENEDVTGVYNYDIGFFKETGISDFY